MSNNLPDTTDADSAITAQQGPGKSLLVPKDFEEALRIAKSLSKSRLVPKQFQGEPEDIVVAIQWGLELGLQPMQALQNIAVIRGNPSLYGSVIPALARTHPKWDESKYRECYVGEPYQDDYAAVCQVGRTDADEAHEKRFSVKDAKQAGLWGKKGPWKKYPKRMLQHRARKYAIDDVFADVLKGMPLADEARHDLPDQTEGAVELEADFEEQSDSRTDELRAELEDDHTDGQGNPAQEPVVDGAEVETGTVEAEPPTNTEDAADGESDGESEAVDTDLPEDFPFRDLLLDHNPEVTVSDIVESTPSQLERIEGIGPDRSMRIHNAADLLHNEKNEAEPELEL